MAKTRRKKKHPVNAAPPVAPGQEKTPKSFVFSRGAKLGLRLRLLERDLRQVMLPHTAKRLKESHRNSLKDFLHVAGPLGVTHFVMLSATKEAPYLRLARTPRGPTLTFKVLRYTLAADIARAQKRPRAPPSMYETQPLVVMNGLLGPEPHMKLITIMFQHMFPTIDVNTVKLARCQRVLLLNFDKTTQQLEVRHFSIRVQPVGVSRNIRKLVQRRQLPNLSGLSDVSEFVTRSGYGSESENEDEASNVHLAQKVGRANQAAGQSAVKLQEVGPRLTLQLLKIEEGLCNGAVMFHHFVKKSPEEAAAQKAQVEEKAALKAKRKAEQEANVRRKKRKRSGGGDDGEGEDDGDGQDGGEEDGYREAAPEDPTKNARRDDDADDDAEYYRQEVGEEPDEGFLSAMGSGFRSRGRGRGRGAGRGRGRHSQGDGGGRGGRGRFDGASEGRGGYRGRGSRGGLGDGARGSYGDGGGFAGRGRGGRLRGK